MLVGVPRAQRMDADDRRATIVAATRDVLARQGVGFTTRAVAEAAGVAEGTVFRVFASKDELLWAVVADLLDLVPTCERIEALPGDATLADQIGAILTIIGDQVSGVHSAEVAIAAMSRGPAGAAELFQAAHAGRPLMGEPSSTASPGPCAPFPDPKASFDRLRTAVAGALAPYRADLRLELDQAVAWVWLAALATTHPFLSRITHIEPDEATDVLVHGLAKDPVTPSC